MDEQPGGCSTGGSDLPKVVFVSSHSTPGGSETVLLDLLGALPAPVVSAVVALQEGPLVARLRRQGVPVTVLPTAGSLPALVASATRLAGQFRRDRPAAVHGNGVKAALVSVLAARIAAPRRPVPVVWMKHDVSLDGAPGRVLAARCAAVACVSREVQRGLRGAGRSIVVPPGVRVDAARAARDGAALRGRLGLHAPVVSVVGRLDPAKGHAELLEVLPAVSRAVPGASALLVGPDVPEHPGVRAGLRRRAGELGLGQSVHVLGHAPAATVLAASDAVCVPTVPRSDGSGREGFGLVAAQALALGVPVVAYDVGATREVLGACGTLVPRGDRAALAGQLVRLLSDPAARQTAATCGHERAADLTVERMAAGLLELYRQAA